ncbi:hypothetical protein FRC20_007121 [Serendipita sp. 405]|nr:hypothetical protein FRC15_007172 [Serendipita sp. 397]KAG8836148.1 hypothetical protein FRC20_007121 [Serendipita sp. 405]
MVAAAAIKIPPALQLPPRLPLDVRADATQSPLLDTPTRTFPNSVPLESPAGSSIGSPLGNAIVGMGLAVPLPLPRPPIGSPRSSDTRRLRSESSSSRTNSESNSSRARSESASSAASSSRQGYFSSSVSSQNSSLSSSVLFSPRRTSYKAKSKNPSTQSIGSGAGVAMNLDDICDGFLRNIDEDAQESGIEPLFMTSKPSTRKRGVTQVQTQGSHEKFISPCDPQSTLLSYDVSPLAKTTASAPPTVLTFDTRRNRTDSFSNAHTSTMPLPHSTSTTDSDSGNSVDSASTQMTPTKNSRSIRRHDVPVLCFEKQRAMTSPTISGQSTQMAVSVSEASVSSLPYLRSPGVDAGVAASSNQDGPFSSSRASSQTLPAPVSADSFHCLSQPTYPEVDVVSDLPVITAKEPQFGIRPYSSHSQHYDRPASTYSVTSTNSQFSQFSLSLFPSPPSVPFLRPTTDKGTFLTGPSTPEAGNGTETGQSSTYKFKSIVPSRKTPRVQPLLPTDDFSILSSHSRSDSTSSYPLTLGTSSQQPGSLRAASPLPPPNYEALLRSMEATSPLDNSVISMQEGSLGIQVVHAKEAFPNLKVTPSFGGYGPAQLDLPTMASEENSRPGTANSRFQWGYAL